MTTTRESNCADMINEVWWPPGGQPGTGAVRVADAPEEERYRYDRPLRRAHPLEEVAVVGRAANRLVRSREPRLAMLAAGAQDTWLWLVQATRTTIPLLRAEVPDPCVADVRYLLIAAHLDADGHRLPGSGPVTDVGRVYARGVFDVCCWWLYPTAPMPLWAELLGDDAVVAAQVVGDVGRDLAVGGWASTGAGFPG